MALLPSWWPEAETPNLPTGMALLLLLLGVMGCAPWIYFKVSYIDFPALNGIPEPQGASLLYGHLRLLVSPMLAK
jgi:hypothetical protein